MLYGYCLFFVCLCIRVMLNKLVCFVCDLLCLFVMLHDLFLIGGSFCGGVWFAFFCVVLRLSVGVSVCLP